MQLSDFHYAPGLTADRGLEDAKAIIHRLNPDLIIVSGDLTREGLFEQFVPVIEFLNSVGMERVRAIPGNRDYLAGGLVPLPPAGSDFDYFLVAPDTPDTANPPEGKRVLTTPFTRFFDDINFFEKAKGVAIAGVDSEPVIAEDAMLKALNFFAESPAKSHRVFCTHRSLLPIPRKKLKEGDVLANSGDILEQLVQAGVHLTLCAHLHRVHAWQLSNGEHSMVVVNAPSLLDRSPGKENGLLSFDLGKPGQIRVTLHPIGDEGTRVLIDVDAQRPRKKRAS